MVPDVAGSINPMKMQRLYALVIKEFLSYLRDPLTRTILIGPPLMQLLIFSFAATLELSRIDIAVLNRDAGSHAKELVERLSASSLVDEIVPVNDPATLRAMIDERKVLLAMQFAPDFSRRACMGEEPSLQLLLDGRRANAAQIAERYITEIAGKLFEPRSGSSTLLDSPPTPSVRHQFNPNLSQIWYVVPSLSAVLALMISLLISSLSIARERELGTFDQLLVSPLSSGEIIAGKCIPAILIGAGLGILMMLAGVLLFRIPFTGSALWLLSTLFVFILSSAGIGLVVSSIARTQQQAILGAFALVVPLILTSGFATPVENMPIWLQNVSLANPLRHFLIIVQGSFLKALPSSDVLASTLPLIAIATLTLGLAVIVVRHRLI